MRSIFDKARSLIAALIWPGAQGAGRPRPPQSDGSFDERLLAVLACPSSGEPLRHDAEAGELVADRHGLAYRIVDGIPILLASEARSIQARDAQGPAC